MSEHENALRLQTPLGRVRGLGSAKRGTHHWWMQRVTSIALLPLTIWFVFAVWGLAGATHEEALAFIASPLNAVLLISLIAATFHHMAAGLQVVIEDYLRDDRARIAALLAVKGACWLLALLAALSVLRIAV
jgi:succinate dehydrogenase / fumarate reductase membrane anchor subunit